MWEVYKVLKNINGITKQAYCNLRCLCQCFSIVALVIFASDSAAKVQLEKQILISKKGLFFDGTRVAKDAPNGAKYDYIFGRRITPHGDCIKVYNGFVFMTWYRGGEDDRHVMLSRYNPKTGVTKTIEFPHRHTGFQNKPHLGESHNTIAIGISPINGTIHMLYDMHSYSEKRPANGSLAKDYFRYSYSKKNVATLPDDEFTLDKFVNSRNGNYKHLEMRPGVDYRSLTYPNFFTNTQGELFMWIREGGHNNGAYKFAKYDGDKWSDFTQFNILAAKRSGMPHNWGLYGDIKFESGKLRIGFHIRSGDDTDKHILNNGFFYGVSDDPLGEKQWKNYKGEPFSLPVIDPALLKISEPGDLFTTSKTDSVKISRGADWTVTDRGDVHFVSTVTSSGQRKSVHTYKKDGDTNFTTKTNFPGGNLYTTDNQVFLIGLENGRVFVEKADGGTNNWERIYTSENTQRNYRHGNVYIFDGKLYYYLMEKSSGSAQPIYLEIFDLGIGEDASDMQKPPKVSAEASMQAT